MQSDTVHTIIQELINEDRTIWQSVADDIALARPLVESYCECDGDLSERYFDEHHLAAELLSFALEDFYRDMLPADDRNLSTLNSTRHELHRFKWAGANPLLSLIDVEMDLFPWHAVASDILNRIDLESLAMSTFSDTQVFTEEQINAARNSNQPATGGEPGEHRILIAD